MSSLKLTVLIVEDNLSFALEMQMLLDELDYNTIGIVDNAKDALEQIEAEYPDLILMDVDLKGDLTGIDLGKQILPLNIPILYITALKEEKYYLQALNSNLIGFLGKPVDKMTLRSTIGLAILKAYKPTKDSESESGQEDEEDRFIANKVLYFKKKGAYQKVQIEDIIYVKSDDNYCESHTVNGEMFTTRCTMKRMEEMLPNSFLRVHRQYLVQLDLIDTVDFQRNMLKINQTQIPVSRSRRRELEEIVKKNDLKKQD